MISLRLTLGMVKNIILHEKEFIPTVFAYRGSERVLQIKSRKNLFYEDRFIESLKRLSSGRNIDSIFLAVPMANEPWSGYGYEFAVIYKSRDMAKTDYFQLSMSYVGTKHVRMRFLVTEEVDKWPLEQVLEKTTCSPVEVATAKGTLMALRENDESYEFEDLDERDQETAVIIQH